MSQNGMPDVKVRDLKRKFEPSPNGHVGIKPDPGFRAFFTKAMFLVNKNWGAGKSF